MDEQLRFVKRSGLEDIMHKLFYGVVGDPANVINLAVQYNSDKYVQVGCDR